MMSRDRSPTIAVIGGYLTANKGGAAMTLAVHQHVRRVGGTTKLLTIYPAADRASGADLEVVSWRPLDLLVSAPLALLIAVLRAAHLPHRFLARTAGLRALLEADLVVDVAGISFVDGRGLPILGYNVLMTGIPLLVGAPVVKASQALGPFEQRLNRTAARLVLPRVRTICARGDRTAEHLRTLGLSNVRPAADLAFALEVDEDDRRGAEDLTQALTGGRPFVSIVPSAVVQRYCDANAIDYTAALAELARAVIERDRDVLVVPHSVHPEGKPGRMHDLPVCDALVRAVGDDRCHLVDPDLGPTALRALIGRGDALVTSRFHAMISGLCTSTPTLVMGWSHKYAEVLGAFGLERWSVDHSQLGGDEPRARLAELLAEGAAVRRAIEGGLPAVEASARANFAAVDEALRAVAA